MSGELPAGPVLTDADFQLSRVLRQVTELLESGPEVTVPIASLLPSDSLRTEGENAKHVRILAELEGDTPPIIVHRKTMRVIDGMHRLRAAIIRGRRTIDVRFSDGDERDMVVLAVGLNSRHGLPLSQKDRASAAYKVMVSHPHWSDRAIAQIAGLSSKTVAGIRRRTSAEIPHSNARLGHDGRVRPLNTVRGRRLASRLMAERPHASLREIAGEAGVSLGTAQDVRRRLRLGQDPVPPTLRKLEQAEGPVVDLHGGTDRMPRDQDGTMSVLPALKNDPSLRLSEIGRMVLRLLDAHSISPEVWARLADAVPAHCADSVAGLARQCASSWLEFAEQVEKRGEHPG